MPVEVTDTARCLRPRQGSYGTLDYGQEVGASPSYGDCQRVDHATTYEGVFNFIEDDDEMDMYPEDV